MGVYAFIWGKLDRKYNICLFYVMVYVLKGGEQFTGSSEIKKKLKGGQSERRAQTRFTGGDGSQRDRRLRCAC